MKTDTPVPSPVSAAEVSSDLVVNQKVGIARFQDLARLKYS